MDLTVDRELVDAQGWDALARRAVGVLTERGCRAGDRFVLLADNSPASLALTWGALRAGIVPVPLNTVLADGQVRELAADARPRLVVTDPAGADRLTRELGGPPQGRGPDLASPRVWGGAPEGMLAPDWVLTGSALAAARPSDDLAAVPLARPMHYTSGTTGRSKGVWSGLLSPDLARAWADDEGTANPTGPDDVHLVCSHLFHSGPHRYAVNTLNHGGHVIVQPRFDAGATLRAIAAHRVTTAFMVPTHLARLLDHPALPTTDLSSLRWIHHAGAACPEPLKRRALAAFPAGVLHEFYGSTEGQFTRVSPAEWLEHPGSVGQARPGRRLEVTDDDGTIVPPGTVGTVWVSAPPHGRFTYWDDPVRTAAAWRERPDAPSGTRHLFTVGDLGSLDADGWLTLAGRRGDLIISGGVNVYPAEVERALLAHPAVLEGVVFGRPHPDWGQQVTAAVVPRRGVTIDPGEVRAFLRARLAGFQTPKEVVVVDELPRTASGKILRAALAGDLPDA